MITSLRHWFWSVIDTRLSSWPMIVPLNVRHLKITETTSIALFHDLYIQIVSVTLSLLHSIHAMNSNSQRILFSNALPTPPCRKNIWWYFVIYFRFEITNMHCIWFQPRSISYRRQLKSFTMVDFPQSQMGNHVTHSTIFCKA